MLYFVSWKKNTLQEEADIPVDLRCLYKIDCALWGFGRSENFFLTVLSHASLYAGWAECSFS